MFLPHGQAKKLWEDNVGRDLTEICPLHTQGLLWDASACIAATKNRNILHLMTGLCIPVGVDKRQTRQKSEKLMWEEERLEDQALMRELSISFTGKNSPE